MPSTVIEFGPVAGDAYDATTREYVQRVAELAQSAASDEKHARTEFQELLATDHSEMFDAMDAFYAGAIEASQWAAETVTGFLDLDNEEDQDLADLYLVLRGITARAMAVYSEISWLLRGGYGGGANARVRTLYELALTAHVLIAHGSPDGQCPDLAIRYKSHQDCFLAASATELLQSRSDNNESQSQDPLAALRDPNILRELNTRKEQLIEKYGKSFARGSWGGLAHYFRGSVR